MGRNVDGLAVTLAAMRDAGQLEDVDGAVVALAESLAVAVDSDRCLDCQAAGQNSSLWREYRAAVAALREAGAKGGDDDDTAEWVVAVRTPVVNPKAS